MNPILSATFSCKASTIFTEIVASAEILSDQYGAPPLAIPQVKYQQAIDVMGSHRVSSTLTLSREN
jgi:hypothetical protein